MLDVSQMLLIAPVPLRRAGRGERSGARGRRYTAAALFAATAVLVSRLRRVEVAGASMRPTLEPGDRLLILRGHGVEAGDIVAIGDPRESRRVVVKRVAATTATKLSVLGDRASASTDSRSFGWVNRKAVRGRVVYRYFPAHRRGRISRGWYAGSTMLADEVEGVLARKSDDLSSQPIEEIRSLRVECQRIETRASYLRRLLQGRLDIVTAELDRRTAGEAASDLPTLVERLPEILADSVHAGGTGRLPSHLEPPGEDDDLTAELEAVVGARDLGELPELGAEELQATADRLRELERQVSAHRHGLHDLIDALQAELTRRYKSGEATVESLLQ